MAPGSSVTAGAPGQGCARGPEGAVAPAGKRLGWTGLALVMGAWGAGGGHLGKGSTWGWNRTDGPQRRGLRTAPSTVQPPEELAQCGTMACPGRGPDPVNNPYLFEPKSQGPSGQKQGQGTPSGTEPVPGQALGTSVPVTGDEMPLPPPVPKVRRGLEQPLICGNGNA